MRFPTKQNIINLIAGLTVQELLTPCDMRKAFIFGPLGSGAPSSQGLVAVQLGLGTLANFVVPAGVTQIADIWAWGPGGSAGAAGASLGGGGGGGGSFCTSGNLTVSPGQIFQYTVGAGGSGTATIVNNNAGVTIISAGAGQGGTTATGG